MSREPLAARLLATFLGELEEQVRAMNADALALEADPASPEALRSLFRSAHTLKGAAHAAGVPRVEEVCHALEGLLAAARDGLRAVGPGEVAVLLGAADALADAGERLRRGEGLEGAPIDEVRRALRGGSPVSPVAPRLRAEADDAASVPAPSPIPAPSSDTGSSPADGGSAAAPSPSPSPRGSSPGIRASVRVEPEKLDALLAATGEVFAASAAAAVRLPALQRLHDDAEAVLDACRRALRHARAPGGGGDGGALEALEALEGRLAALAGAAGGAAADARRDARGAARAAEALDERVRRVRMRPFSDVAEALPRTVRDVAARAGKEVALHVRGGEVEADRAVWDAVREAVLHLVRNAVDHGVEAPEVRAARGKPPAGTVSVSAEPRGDRVVVTVADDGAGIDAAGLRARLAERGLPVPAGDGELARALLRGGISSRARATEFSGRGVGLDSARAALARIRGSVDVSWTPGEGTTVVLECPPALLTQRVVLAEAGGVAVALPTACVERLARVGAGDLRRVGGRDVLPGGDGPPVPLASLGALLGREPPSPAPGVSLRVVRLSAGGRRLAVAVDGWTTEQEVLVRPLRGVRSPPPLVAGAAILGSGEVALVLSPAAVVDAGLAGGGAAPLVAEAPAEARRARILVVDDSITTRALEQSILEAAGYEVATAADGADGWRAVQDGAFDLVVSDVEMPRMDGFALCRAIRASPRLRRLPVVLVTALESAAHRAEGMEAGADAYLPKSSFDQERLLEAIRQMVGP